MCPVQVKSLARHVRTDNPNATRPIVSDGVRQSHPGVSRSAPRCQSGEVLAALPKAERNDEADRHVFTIGRDTNVGLGPTFSSLLVKQHPEAW